MNRASVFRILAVFALLVLPLAAQCTVNASFQQYGIGCNTVFGVLPTLSGTFNPANCSVTITLTGFGGCCNTFLVSRLLAFGVNAANVPLPTLGPGCVLLVEPAVVLEFPNSAGNSFTFVLPPFTPTALTLFAQGANHYFTTIGLSDDYELSNGLAMMTF
jgi:hypothetical protein